jgi:hypothetical protein
MVGGFFQGMASAFGRAAARSGSTVNVRAIEQKARGHALDSIYGNPEFLRSSFPGVDRLHNGVVTRMKSINITKGSYETTSQLFSKMKGHIEDLAAKHEWGRGATAVRPRMYSVKECQLIIPDVTPTAAQQAAISKARSHAASLGIRFTLIVHSCGESPK